jgi:hypothetical protein
MLEKRVEALPTETLRELGRADGVVGGLQEIKDALESEWYAIRAIGLGGYLIDSLGVSARAG